VAGRLDPLRGGRRNGSAETARAASRAGPPGRGSGIRPNSRATSAVLRIPSAAML